MSENISKKQQLFISEYVKDLNGASAYKRAGYKAKNDNVDKVCASKLLTKPNVKPAVEKLMQNRAEKNLLTADWVLKHLKENADRCMQYKPVVDRCGHHETGVYKREPKAANKSLELIGKHIGMFLDKIEHSGTFKGVDTTFIDLKNAK